ncbi:MAG: 50S ribosomal protein L29 [Nitrososphaerales archaeon]|nr:50S ribosomal protein L29 [Nitrososphaerales archaeon]
MKVPKLKSEELRKLSDEDLQDKFFELRAELVKLKSESSRGTLKKETGKIRSTRRAIARILTIINERKLGR